MRQRWVGRGFVTHELLRDGGATEDWWSFLAPEDVVLSSITIDHIRVPINGAEGEFHTQTALYVVVYGYAEAMNGPSPQA